MSNRPTRHPSIPDSQDQSVQALKESIEIGRQERGDPLDGWVRFRDLADAGAGVSVVGGRVRIRTDGDGPFGDDGGPGPGGGPLPIGSDDQTKPIKPKNVNARGLSLTTIGVSWADPGYSNHAYAEVFASSSDNWPTVLGTFNPSKPIGPGNQTSYFMGTSPGSLFLHRGLESSVPSPNFRYAASSITQLTGQVEVSVATPADFVVGETVFFSYDGDWDGNSFQGEVAQVLGSSIVIDGTMPSGALPEPPGVEVVRNPDTGELDNALDPTTYYYWVRFVSQAGVVGDVQSEAGVPGQVFIDPEKVLDILTGRIRKTQLAQDIVQPVNLTEQSIVMRVGKDENGVLSTAGFGLGLEQGEDGDLISTFAIAADQFAIMGAGADGRKVTSVGPNSSSEHVIQYEGPQPSWSAGKRVTLTIPSGNESWKDALRGIVFEVSSVTASGIYLVQAEDEDFNALPASTSVSGEGVGIFPEQSIPFVVDTDTSTVGIRGKLVVDGMISAREAEIQELAATTIFSQNIINWGLINTKSLLGEVIATPRIAGWSIRMSSPDFGYTADKVLEFSRWGSADDTVNMPDPNDESQQDPSNWPSYPQLAEGAEDESAFWLRAADGSAYIRGSLTVGNNARFWTGSGMGSSDYMVQIDNEFPLSIVNKGDAINAGFPSAEGGSVSYTQALKDWVRANALLWAQRSGLIGFNTDNNAVFAGGTPLEPPSGHGYITVLSTLENGAPTGKGRIHLGVDFALANNQATIGPDASVGVTLALYLVDAGTDYGLDSNGDQLGYCYAPEDFNNTGGVDIGPILDYMNTHFLIIQAEDSSTDDAGDDPGYDRFKKWQDEHSGSISKFKELWHHNKGSIAMSASKSAIASGNYRYLVVVVNRFFTDGSEVYGSPPQTSEHTLPYAATAFVQQVSSVNYTGPTSANSGAGGGGGGPGSGGDDSGSGDGGGAGAPGDPGTITP